MSVLIASLRPASSLSFWRLVSSGTTRFYTLHLFFIFSILSYYFSEPLLLPYSVASLYRWASMGAFWRPSSSSSRRCAAATPSPTTWSRPTSRSLPTPPPPRASGTKPRRAGSRPRQRTWPWRSPRPGTATPSDSGPPASRLGRSNQQYKNGVFFSGAYTERAQQQKQFTQVKKNLLAMVLI